MKECVEEITKRLEVLKKYYSSNVEDEILVMWAVDLLEEYSKDEIITAIVCYKRHETYSPTLAGIIKYIPKCKVDYAQVVLDTVRSCGMRSEKGREKLKHDLVALDLYDRYGTRVGMSEPCSTSQKFLFEEINDEAEAQIKYNTKTVNCIENKKLLD